jgi:hypothetical protein
VDKLVPNSTLLIDFMKESSLSLRVEERIESLAIDSSFTLKNRIKKLKNAKLLDSFMISTSFILI